MVVGFGAGVVPSTTSNARGALLWVFGARGDIGAVTPVGHLNNNILCLAPHTHTTLVPPPGMPRVP